MSQFQFLNEDADSPQSPPPAAPPTPLAPAPEELLLPPDAPASVASQPAAPQPPAPVPPAPAAPKAATPAPAVPTPALPSVPALPDLDSLKVAAPVSPAAPTATPPAPRPAASPAAPTPQSAPVAPQSPTSPPAPGNVAPSAAPRPSAPPLAGIPPQAGTPQGGQPQQQPGVPRPLQPQTPPQPQAQPLQPRPLQPRTAPGTPQAASSAQPKLPTPGVPGMPGLGTPGAVPVADAEMLASSHVPSDDAGGALYSLGRSITDFLDKLEGPASWVLRITLPVAGLCLAFVLAALLFGAVANFDANPQKAVLLRNLSLAGDVLKWTLALSAIATFIAGYQDNRLGAIGVAVGLALTLGTPLAIKAVGKVNLASGNINSHLITTGTALLVVSGIKATLDLMAFLWTAPDRIRARNASVGGNRPIEAQQRKVAREANMFSPCWKLPFCREAIRKMCPAFLARTTCWKFKRGCYCDEEMIGRIVRGENLEAIKAPTKISQSRKPPCGRCYIYLEHQSFKFRMLSPLAFPSSVALTYFLWPFYGQAFTQFTALTNSIQTMFAFKPPVPDAIKATEGGEAAAAASQMTPEMVATYFQWIFGLLLGFMFLIYISKFIEWAIYKAKL